MLSTPESKVRDPVVSWAKANGFLHQRMAFRIGVKQAMPDDLFIAPGGVHVWVEFKAAGKEPTPLQYDRLNKLLGFGAMAFWANDRAEAIAALQRVINMSMLLMSKGVEQ